MGKEIVRMTNCLRCIYHYELRDHSPDGEGFVRIMCSKTEREAGFLAKVVVPPEWCPVNIRKVKGEPC